MSYTSELSYGELQDLEFSRSCRQDLENSRSCRQDLAVENSRSCRQHLGHFKIWKIQDLAGRILNFQDLAGRILNFQDPAGNTLAISRFLSFYNVTNFLKNYTRKLHAIFVWHEVHHYRKTIETTTVFAEKMDQGFSEVRISRIISLQCCMHRLFCLL